MQFTPTEEIIQVTKHGDLCWGTCEIIEEGKKKRKKRQNRQKLLDNENKNCKTENQRYDLCIICAQVTAWYNTYSEVDRKTFRRIYALNSNSAEAHFTFLTSYPVMAEFAFPPWTSLLFILPTPYSTMLVTLFSYLILSWLLLTKSWSRSLVIFLLRTMFQCPLFPCLWCLIILFPRTRHLLTLSLNSPFSIAKRFRT